MRTKHFLSAALVFALALAVAGAGQQSAEQLFKKGLYEEEVGGDLQKAIAIYQDLLKRFPESRGTAAMAQLHIGLCYEKMGTAEAEKAFQKVLDNYPEQAGAVKEAKEKLSLLLRSRALQKTGDSEFRLRLVWSGAGVDTMGAVSPDGRFVSFVDWETGDLAVRDIAAGTNRRLTNKGPFSQSPEFALFSKWSPDGGRIVYQWYNKDEIFELRVFDMKNATSRILYQNAKKDEYVQPFDWSPDGKHVVTVFFRGPAPVVGKDIQLGLVSVADGTVKILKSQFDTQPGDIPWGFVFSPDGNFIAYDVARAGKAYEKRDIFLLPAGGGAEMPLIQHPAVDTVVDWTPDGQALLFMSDRTGTPDAWMIRVAKGQAQGNPQLLKSGLGLIESMGFAANGSLYYGLTGGATDVYEVGIDPQTGRILSPAKKAAMLNEGHNAYPDYSPDGKLLAYISSPGMPAARPRRVINVLSRETGQVRELGLDLTGFHSPHWAPDGRALSVVGMDPKSRIGGIYRVDVQTSDVAPIVQIERGKEIYSHRWSRDGKAIFYTIVDQNSKASFLFVHSFETGRQERLPGSPSDAYWIDISPDGRWLALINRDQERVLRVMPASGGDPREVYRYEQGQNFIVTPAWSADGRYIFLSKKQAGAGDMWDIFRVPAEGGEAQKIDVTGGQIRQLSVHPDGRAIAFSSRGPNPEQSQVWVMENFLPAGKK